MLTLSVLLLCFAFLIFTDTKSNPYLLFSTSTTSTSTATTALQSSLPSSPSPPRQNDGVAAAAVVINADPNSPRIDWKLCKGTVAVDFIPCLDNFKAIKALKARRHMEHRERHCPDPNPRCLVPLPAGYRIPLPWPKSRDMVRWDFLFPSFYLFISFKTTAFSYLNCITCHNRCLGKNLILKL